MAHAVSDLAEHVEAIAGDEAVVLHGSASDDTTTA
jgi:hypothetical protein